MSKMTESNHEQLILDFESLWSKGQRPSVFDFVESIHDRSLRSQVLHELVCIDLEFQWKAVSHGEQIAGTRLEDYVAAFTELGSLAALPMDLVEEEYRARTRWGDRPSHNDFAIRFESRKGEVIQALRQVDVEIDRESETVCKSTKIRDGRSRVAAGSDSRAPLAYADYLLQQMVGAGRMGRVYRATQKSTNRHVAIKFLRKAFLQSTEAVEQFVREANVVSNFDHPGIVQVHGLGVTPGGGYFIAMDLVEGPNLATRRATTVVTVQEAVLWTRQACLALNHSHESGIIHCDLKPANLLLDETDQVRVTDFGLARSISDHSHSIARVEGTAAYMAPEQISRWWGEMSVRTDVYGMGAVLYELLTGRPPFTGRTLTDILSRVVSGVEPVSPKLLRPELPSTLVDVCLRCLAKQPTDRYQNLTYLANALSDELEASQRN